MDAVRAAAELRAALAAAGIGLPSLEVDPCVWDSAKAGTVRLVELGAVAPDTAYRLARIVRTGTGRVLGAAVALSGEGADLAPGSMAYPPCRCHRCVPQQHAGERRSVRNAPDWCRCLVWSSCREASR